MKDKNVTHICMQILRFSVSATFFLMLTFSCSGEYHNRKKLMEYSETSILNDLDDCGKTNPYKFFPDLAHGYFSLIDTRITLFADKTRWAIVFEKSVFSNRDNEAQIQLSYYGNCLINLTYFTSSAYTNVKVEPLIKHEDFIKLFGERQALLPGVNNLFIRGKTFLIERDPQKYQSRNIILAHNDTIDAVSVLRYLNETDADSFRATNEEVRQCLPMDLPKIMTIDRWHHEAYTNYGTPQGTLPSQQEAYQLMAKVLVSKDTSVFKPTLKPNNDWRSWSQSGGL